MARVRYLYFFTCLYFFHLSVFFSLVWIFFTCLYFFHLSWNSLHGCTLFHLAVWTFHKAVIISLGQQLFKNSCTHLMQKINVLPHTQICYKKVRNILSDPQNCTLFIDTYITSYISFGVRTRDNIHIYISNKNLLSYFHIFNYQRLMQAISYQTQ